MKNEGFCWHSTHKKAGKAYAEAWEAFTESRDKAVKACEKAVEAVKARDKAVEAVKACEKAVEAVEALEKAQKAYSEAVEALEKAREFYNKMIQKHRVAIEKLHNGKELIFEDTK